MTIFIWGGYLFGNVPIIKNNFGIVTIAIIVISVLPVVWGLLKPAPHERHRCRRISHRHDASKDRRNLATAVIAPALIATAIGEPVKVRLAQPVPIERDAEVTPRGPAERLGSACGRDADRDSQLRSPSTADVPQPPSWVEAFGASQHFAGFRSASVSRAALLRDRTRKPAMV